jgi:DNA-binding transcriptional MerR regulator
VRADRWITPSLSGLAGGAQMALRRLLADDGSTSRPSRYIDANVNGPSRVSPMNSSSVRPKEERSYTITELAHEFDITPRAIRFYEDMGLLAPGRAGRNRVYNHRDRTRLKLTLRGKRLGFSLTEIRQLVTMYESPADTALQLEAFRSTLAQHRQQLEQQLEDLEVTLAEIAQHEARCEKLLADRGLTVQSAPSTSGERPSSPRRRKATASSE